MMYEPAEERTLKIAFAAAYLRNPNDAYAAARSVEPHAGKAAWIAANWTFDPLVMEAQAEFQQKSGAASMLPSHDEFSLKLYREIDTTTDAETKLKYYKLFAESMGFIRKPDENRNGSGMNVFMNKVMVVPVASTADDWEAQATGQQAKLLANAS